MTALQPGPASPPVDLDGLRRRRNVMIIGVGLALMAAVMLPTSLAQGAPAQASLILAAAVALFLGAAGLARAGQAGPAALLIVGVSIVANLVAMIVDPNTPSLPFFLVLATMLATVLLPPIHIWSVLVICLLGNALAGVFFAPGRRDAELWSEAIANSSLLLIAVAVIGYLGASGITAALSQARVARDEAEAAGRALAASNATLEQRVEERTAVLRQIADEHRAAAAELKASLQAQHDLNRIVAGLAVPVIPVSADTLVVPLVGTIDGARAEQILASVLGQIEHAAARTVVLDVTGVAVVDTQVAAALLQVAQATRLMGAETVLAGIRPEVAQALVGLGADLSQLRTVSTLQEAL